LDIGASGSFHNTVEQALEARAAACTLDLRLDDALTSALADVRDGDGCASPWLLCYAAMRERLMHANAARTLELAQAAYREFVRVGNVDGQVRALAEVGSARYQLGQRTTALAELNIDLTSTQPACVAALSLAIYLNALGVDDLQQALAAVECGVQVLDQEQNSRRRAVWRVMLQRNAAAAYHFNGQLARARAAAEEALSLVETHQLDASTHARTLYEAGLLEQRAGRLDVALMRLEQARDLIEPMSQRDPFWRWIVAAEGRTLRDRGQLDAAQARYSEGGWGEGDEGPLWLWVLQGGYAEARASAEVQRRAAQALGSPVEIANAEVFFALIDLEAGATSDVARRLRAATADYARFGFRHNHASVLLHLSAVEYALGNDVAGDEALAVALRFGAAQGYHNFVWWHPARMGMLLRRAIERGIEADYSATLLHERRLGSSGADAPSNILLPPAQSLALRCLGRFEVEIDGESLPVARWQGHAAGALRMQRLLLF
jgi:tetratricopeptide (TPR) repeat protein